jgi:cystathionine beta-lyase
MWVADMDFRSAPEILQAMRQRLEHGVFGYTRPPAELIETVVAMLDRDHGWQVDPAWLVWLPGLVTGLNVSCRAVGADGDDVLTLVPVYPPFLSAPGHSRRGLVTVPLAEQAHRWTIDFDRLEAALTPRTRMFILCNPHNPVGRVFSRQELNRLAELCLRRDIVICSDEIHCGLVLERDKRHIPTATLDPEVAGRTITLMAPSKTFNIPGLGCSFAVISSENLRRRFKTAMAGIVPMLNPFGYVAAASAYRDGGPWHAALLEYLRGNRDLVDREIQTMPELSMAPVEATFLAWIDTRASGIEDPVRFFEAAGVGLQDGREFAGPGFVRMNFGCRRALLQEALARMATALARRRNAGGGGS